mgnify:CR=1 FL=1
MNQSDYRLGFPPAMLALGLMATPTLAQSDAVYSVVETGRGYARLQDAVKAVGRGSGTIRVAPGRHADCGCQYSQHPWPTDGACCGGR